MVYTHFVGRIAQDAKVISGNFGAFVTFDVAVDSYNKGENNTMFIRLRSKKEYHINLSQYLTKGKLILVEGQLNNPTVWTDKNGNQRVQLSVTFDNVQFVAVGKKKDGENNNTQPVEITENTAEGNTNNGVPFEAPADTEENLPF